MGWGLGDIFGGAVDSVKDFVSDPIGEIGQGLGTIGNAIGDVGQYVGNAVGNAWQGTYNNLDNYWKDSYELMNNSFEGAQDAAGQALDPKNLYDVGDLRKLRNARDLVKTQLGRDNEIGDAEFGDGGWIHGGMNAAGYYFGAGPVGDYYYMATDAAQGRKYDGGRTAGPQALYNMYNSANSAYNSAGASDSALPTDSNTYTEATPGGGTTTVTPGDYYSGATTGAGSVVSGNNTNNTGLNMDYNSYTGPGLMGEDYTPDLGQQPTSLDGLSNFDIGSTPSPYVSGTAPNSFLDDTRNFMNSRYGKGIGAVAKAVNPTLGAIVNGGADVLNGSYGKAAFDTLGSLYLNNQVKRNQQKYQDQMNNSINRLQGIADPNSVQNQAYQTQLSNELNRRDAASGRRSQYGTRAVELNAAMAKLNQGNQALVTPALNALTSQAMQNSIQQQQQARSRQFAALQSMFTPEKSSGSDNGSSLAGDVWNKVSSIWGN